MDKADHKSRHPARSARWGPWKLSPWPGLEPRKLKLLFLHGFACSPRELRPLGQTLTKHGFEVMAPLLPGHGERFPGMNSCRVEDWIEAVRLTFEGLHRDGSPIAIVGYCLGGALALATARELNPRAVVCLSTPVHSLSTELFPPWQDPQIEETEAIENEEQPQDLLGTAPFAVDCHSPLARHWKQTSCHPIVTRQFLDNYQEAIKLAYLDLPEVRCPLAVVHSPANRVVPPENAEAILQRAGGHSHQLIWSEKAGHGLPFDTGRRAAIQDVLRFLCNIDSSEPATF